MGTVPVAQNGVAGYKLRPDQQINFETISKTSTSTERRHVGGQFSWGTRGSLFQSTREEHTMSCVSRPEHLHTTRKWPEYILIKAVVGQWSGTEPMASAHSFAVPPAAELQS